MQKNEQGQKNAEIDDQIVIDPKSNNSQVIEEKPSKENIGNEESFQAQSEVQTYQKQQKQTKQQKQPKQYNKDTSLENISIESPVKKQLNKNESKVTEKPSLSLNKICQKINSLSKQKLEPETISNQKLNSDTYMKSSIKNSHRVKKINKPFYEETFYITGMKENYLLLLSDTNQVLQFPIGMFTTQGDNGDPENCSEAGSSLNQNFHLIKDIKIGQPIKIKLEIDFLRQEKDDRIFNSLQRTIHEEYSERNEDHEERKHKQISIKKSNK